MSSSDNKFNVEISAPNGGADEYALNNKAQSTFETPEVMPSYFYIQFRTNLKGNENNYKVYDQWNNLILSRGGFANNTIYRDTLDLDDGCYVFILEDSGHNGISWWANNDGNGSLLFRNITNSTIAKVFDGDFGAEIRYEFTVNSPLSDKELDPIVEARVYPNPAKDNFVVHLPEESSANISILNSMGQEVSLNVTNQGNKFYFDSSNLSSGVYYVQIKDGNQITTNKLVII